MVTKFEYNDVAKIVDTELIVDVLEPLPEIMFNHVVGMKYKVHSITNGMLVVPEDKLEKVE